MSAIGRYLRTDQNSIWRLDDGGDVLTWRDGETVAFRAELREILLFLGQTVGTLPPFSGLFVLLAACRHRGAPLPDARWKTIRGGLIDARFPTSRQRRLGNLLDSTRSGMEALAEIPDALWDDPRIRFALISVIFAQDPHSRPDLYRRQLADDCAEELAQGRGFEAMDDAKALGRTTATDQGANSLEAGLDALLVGLRRLQSVDLVALVKTGLPSLPTPAEDEVLPPATTSSLIHGLRDDPELGEVAWLSRQCLAGVHLPRARLPEDELEYLGAANLSNRGPLDRLLLSELALDDELLAQRIALQEALYLDREQSQDEPDHHREILVDAGIRMWGHGRVVATAVAMALAAQSGDAGARAVVRTSTSHGMRTSDLGTRDGILEHLDQLDPTPRPAAALRDLMTGDPTAGSRILITHRLALTDPVFAAELEERTGDSELTVLAVDEEGTVEASIHHRASRRVLRRLALTPFPLDTPELARPGRSRASDIGEDLPFRLPHEVTEATVRTPQGDYLTLAKDGRLMLWDAPDRLPVQVLARTPRGARVVMALIEEQLHLVIYDRRNRCLHWWIYDIHERSHREMILPWSGGGISPRQIAAHVDTLLVVESGIGTLYRMGEAEPIQRLEFPHQIDRNTIRVGRSKKVIRIDDGQVTMQPTPPDWNNPEFEFAAMKRQEELRRDYSLARSLPGLLRNITGISIVKGDSLVLHTRGGRRHVLRRIPGIGDAGSTLRFVFEDAPSPVQPSPMVQTDPSPPPQCLRTTTIQGVGEIRVDARGLLHLPSGPDWPRMTLALLSQREIAAVTSDGRRHGPREILDDSNCSAEEIFGLIQQLCEAGGKAS